MCGSKPMMWIGSFSATPRRPGTHDVVNVLIWCGGMPVGRDHELLVVLFERDTFLQQTHLDDAVVVTHGEPKQLDHAGTSLFCALPAASAAPRLSHKQAFL
jgi:hypothetical protein